VIADHGILSIAIPALGCGNGGLNWTIVKKEIELALAGIDCEITIFGPN
jgi:hypothetical protein